MFLCSCVFSYASWPNPTVGVPAVARLNSGIDPGPFSVPEVARLYRGPKAKLKGLAFGRHFRLWPLVECFLWALRPQSGVPDGKKDKFPVLNRESRCGPVGSLRGMLLFGALGDSGLCRGHHTSPRAPECFPVRSERWQCTMAPPGWSWQNLAELAEPAARTATPCSLTCGRTRLRRRSAGWGPWHSVLSPGSSL